MHKKILGNIITIFTLVTIILSLTPSSFCISGPIKIGDYIQLGKYYDEPILWRCVDIDENGPLILSDRILTVKQFDAGGDHKYLDGTPQKDGNDYRKMYGSNLWETSNLRSWLNSTASTGNVEWLDGCPPTADQVKAGYNAYADEKGFMGEGNFTSDDLIAVKTVTQKSLLNYVDRMKLKEGGTETHVISDNIETVVGNYDNVYYHNVTDKMFLLDVKQIYKVYKNGNVLGEDYYIGKPTQKCVDNCDFEAYELAADRNWWTWLRTPFAGAGNPAPHGTRGIDADGLVRSGTHADFHGVRPAFYLDSVAFQSGRGTAESPYTSPIKVTPTPIATKANVEATSPKSNNTLVYVYVIIAVLLAGAAVFAATYFLKKKKVK